VNLALPSLNGGSVKVTLLSIAVLKRHRKCVRVLYINPFLLTLSLHKLLRNTYVEEFSFHQFADVLFYAYQVTD